MKNFLTTLVAFTALIFTTNAQNITWGEDLIVDKATTDIAVVHADKTGVYLKEAKKNRADFLFCT